jgi:hypothetical protein
MAKKKHRKKVRSSKHKFAGHSPRTKRSKGLKRGTHHVGPTHEAHSLSFLGAIKRRRAAGRRQHESHETAGTQRARKAGNTHHSKHAHRHGEPVVTEKSFENMLAFRRFQDHAR